MNTARNKNGKAIVVVLAIVAVAAGAWHFRPLSPAPWTDAEIEILRSLWLGSLPPLPPDPTNAVADDPRAADLGQQLFFDTRMSANGAVSCASCPQPERRFTDGLPKGQVSNSAWFFSITLNLHLTAPICLNILRIHQGLYP